MARAEAAVAPAACQRERSMRGTGADSASGICTTHCQGWACARDRPCTRTARQGRYHAFPLEERVEFGRQRRARAAHRDSLERIRANLSASIGGREAPQMIETTQPFIVARRVALSEKTVAPEGSDRRSEAARRHRASMSPSKRRPDDYIVRAPANH